MIKEHAASVLLHMNKKLDEVSHSNIHEKRDFIDNLAFKSAKLAGTSWAFLIVLAFAGLWLLTGPVFSFSSSWQNFMEAISAFVTLFMVFCLQRSQNKDTLAMQIKLNEIIGALKGANNSLISIENLSEKEIIEFQKRYQNIAEEIHNSSEHSTHSVKTHDMAEKLAGVESLAEDGQVKLEEKF